METVLITPRLRLSLVTRAERGSEELGWLHEWRSDELSMAWSIHPPSKTLEETEKLVANYLPPSSTTPAIDAADTQRFRIAYAIHRLPEPTLLHANPNEPQNKTTDTPSTTTFIGLVTLLPITPSHLSLPAHLTNPSTPNPQPTLVVELAYALLPSFWNRGYATESIRAVLAACRREENRSFWSPWERVWVRAIVNERNPRSRAVLGKCEGVREMGVFVWRGEEIHIGGEWRTEDRLVIFGGWGV
ncbi:hypothetical protein M3J09_011148 [Ascochyta lentis]